MFDTTLIASHPKREAVRKLATLPVAVAVHVLAIATVMVGQLWAVDQVPEVVQVEPLIVHIEPPASGDGDEHTGDKPPHPAPVRKARLPLSQPIVVPSTIPPNTGAEPPEDQEIVPGSEQLGGPGKGGPGPGIGYGSGGVVGTDENAGVPDVPIHIGGDVKAPVPVSRLAPRYPELARIARIQGVVFLEAVIEKDGSVADVRVTRDIGFGCGPAALEAVRSWRYSPATLNGRAVSVYLTIRVTFTLNEVS